MRKRAFWAFVAVFALIVAACGDDTSPEDEARQDGEALGEAIAGLGDLTIDDASDSDAVQDQLDQINSAADELVADTSETLTGQADEVSGIVSDTVDAASSAISDGNFGDAAEAVQDGLSDLDTTVSEFAESNDSVTQAAWEGVQSGFDAE